MFECHWFQVKVRLANLTVLKSDINSRVTNRVGLTQLGLPSLCLLHLPSLGLLVILPLTPGHLVYS